MNFPSTRLLRLNAGVAAACFFLVGSVLCLLRHYNLASYMDLAMFDQMLWSVRSGQGLITSISGNDHLLFPHHFFGEHFSPILYLLALPAGLTRGPEALLVMQALAVGLSAVFVAAWVETRTRSRLACLLAPWIWLSLPGVWMATLYDFHMECFGPLFFMLFLLHFARGSRWLWLWGALYVFTKEDTPLYLAATGLVGAFVFGRKRQGLSVMAVSLLYFAVTLLLIMPAFSPTESLLLANRLPGGTATSLWLHARDVMGDALRWQALVAHLGSLGFLPLLGGLGLLPAMGAIGLMWISTHEVQYQMLSHYPFTVYPLLLLAVGEAWRRILKIKHARLRTAAYVAGLAAMLTGLLWSWTQLGGKVLDVLGEASPSQAIQAAPARRLLATLPPEGNAAGDLNLVAHMARRQELSLLMNPADADWLVLRLQAPYVHFSVPRRTHWFRWLAEPESGYGVWAYDPGRLAILQANGEIDRNAEFKMEISHLFEAEALCRCKEATVVAEKDAINGLSLHVHWQKGGGEVMYGPYVPLAPGKYEVVFRVRYEGPDADFFEFDVTEDSGRSIRAFTSRGGKSEGYMDISMQVDLTSGRDTEFRCRITRNGSLWIDRVTVRLLAGLDG